MSGPSGIGERSAGGLPCQGGTAARHGVSSTRASVGGQRGNPSLPPIRTRLPSALRAGAAGGGPDLSPAAAVCGMGSGRGHRVAGDGDASDATDRAGLLDPLLRHLLADRLRSAHRHRIERRGHHFAFQRLPQAPAFLQQQPVTDRSALPATSSRIPAVADVPGWTPAADGSQRPRGLDRTPPCGVDQRSLDLDAEEALLQG